MKRGMFANKSSNSVATCPPPYLDAEFSFPGCSPPSVHSAGMIKAPCSAWQTEPRGLLEWSQQWVIVGAMHYILLGSGESPFRINKNRLSLDFEGPWGGKLSTFGWKPVGSGAPRNACKQTSLAMLTGVMSGLDKKEVSIQERIAVQHIP